MKKLIFISCLLLFCGCIFTYDPARALLYIQNNSNKAIYVYPEYGNVDSLPPITRLQQLIFIGANMKDSYTIGGTRKKPNFPNSENEITFFFIDEETIRSLGLDEVCKKQKFVKKVTLTKEVLENDSWQYIYDQ